MTQRTDAIQYWENELLDAEQERDALITKANHLDAYVKLLRSEDGEVVLTGGDE